MHSYTDTSVVNHHLHDLISTAGHAGFNQLSKLALELNNALHSHDQQRTKQLRQSIIIELQNALIYLQHQINELQNESLS